MHLGGAEHAIEVTGHARGQVQAALQLARVAFLAAVVAGHGVPEGPKKNRANREPSGPSRCIIVIISTFSTKQDARASSDFGAKDF